MQLELSILTLQNVGENIWYFFGQRSFRIILLFFLWLVMGIIAGMAFQEIFKMKWQESFAFMNFAVKGTPIGFGSLVATLLSFGIGFLFGLIPEGAIVGLIASGSNVNKWAVPLATIISIVVSLSASYVFISSNASKEYIYFIVATAVMGQIFVIILSSSLKETEITKAIALKEQEFDKMNEHYSQKRLAAFVKEAEADEDDDLIDFNPKKGFDLGKIPKFA